MYPRYYMHSKKSKQFSGITSSKCSRNGRRLALQQFVIKQKSLKPDSDILRENIFG